MENHFRAKGSELFKSLYDWRKKPGINEYILSEFIYMTILEQIYSNREVRMDLGVGYYL